MIRWIRFRIQLHTLAKIINKSLMVNKCKQALFIHFNSWKQPFYFIFCNDYVTCLQIVTNIYINQLWHIVNQNKLGWINTCWFGWRLLRHQHETLSSIQRVFNNCDLLDTIPFNKTLSKVIWKSSDRLLFLSYFDRIKIFELSSAWEFLT